MTEAPERRRAPRQPCRGTHTRSGLRLRTGERAWLLDRSPTGACIETDARLSPGRAVDVLLVTAGGTVPSRSTVVYSRVCRLHPTNGARYRVGLHFGHLGAHVSSGDAGKFSTHPQVAAGKCQGYQHAPPRLAPVVPPLRP